MLFQAMYIQNNYAYCHWCNRGLGGYSVPIRGTMNRSFTWVLELKHSVWYQRVVVLDGTGELTASKTKQTGLPHWHWHFQYTASSE